MVRELAVFLSDDSIYDDSKDLSEDGSTCKFVITGQETGRDDHLLSDAVAGDQRVHIFHRQRAGKAFLYYGIVKVFGKSEPRSVPVSNKVKATADEQMKQAVFTSNNPVHVPMMADPTTMWRFKESGIAWVGSMVPASNLTCCFILIDVLGEASEETTYKTAFMPGGATDRDADLEDYVEKQKAKKDIKEKIKIEKKLLQKECIKEEETDPETQIKKRQYVETQKVKEEVSTEKKIKIVKIEKSVG